MNPSEEIKNKLDLVDFIREYIPVKAAGVNFQALCPFHGEKTPSFVISPEKQIWHCFGCGKGGDIFSFVMEMEGLSFPEAVRQLAPRAGVILQHQDPAAYGKRNRLLDIMALSVRYYHYLLQTATGQKARDYLASRGLTPEVIEEWQLGCSPSSWDALTKFLLARPRDAAKKYTAEELVEAGLAIRKEGYNGRYYDRFRDRIMFPINDLSGNPIAYSARLNPDCTDKKVGKYINSPQDSLYDKSRVLFGLDKAKNQIKADDLAIVVEGQMDVIACHQFGFKNAIASSGTALTAEQVALIKRYTHNIALCFDADAAGQLAADRGIKEALAQGLNIKVIIIPNGKDPDEALRHDRESFALAVREARPMMDYYFDKITAGLDLNQVENKKTVAQQMVTMIARLSSKVEADYWLKRVAEALDTDELILRESLPAKTASTTEPHVAQTPLAPVRPREEQLSERLLAIVLKFPNLAPAVFSRLEPEWLEPEFWRTFYKNLVVYYNKSAALAYDAVKKNLAGSREAAEMLDQLVLLGEKDFYACSSSELQEETLKILVELEKYYLQRQVAAASKAMAEAEKAGDETAINQLLEELKVLNDRQRHNQLN